MSATARLVSARPSVADQLPETRRAKPVKWWAAIGVLWLALLLYAWSDWLAGGDAHATPTGATPVPSFDVVTAIAWQILFGGWALVAIWVFLVRPRRQGRGLTLDGMLLVAWFSLWALQDPWLSYAQGWFSYNAVFVNLGCPQCHVPGWMDAGTRAHLPEPLIFMGGMYTGVFTSSLLLANRLMRRAKERWPALGTLGLIGIAWAMMALTDLVLELIWLHNDLYAYSGAFRPLSLFAGTRYQFPIYESVLWGAMWASMACLRYFRNDRGETIAERGIGRVAAGRRGKSVLRLLAVIGVAQSLMLVYNVGIGFMGLHAGPWPRSVLNESYMTAGMCGPGTTHACSDPRVPIARGTASGYATPGGRFASPPGGLPDQLSVSRTRR